MNSLQLNVNLNFQQLLEVVKQLSPTEKVKLNEFIWNENFDIPVEHQKIVLSRIKKSKDNPSRMLDWDDASKTLNP
ncbi:MAG: addiction module protein [Arcicella sp.]|nr:addiction module protein [Arcicella sp.]